MAVVPKTVKLACLQTAFSLTLMGFLTTHLHKNSQNDVKLLES